MEAQTTNNTQFANLENLPTYLCDSGPRFQLGRLEFEPWAWECIPSSILTQALDLHACGIFGDVDDHDATMNLRNIEVLVRKQNGEHLYGGLVYSRWNPPSHPSFMVMTDWMRDLVTFVTAARY